jgi:uncharacterized protein (DUF2345 family)
VAAKGLINVQTANAHIDFAAAKKITLQTAGGASMVFHAGGIEINCPGTITVHAASKSMSGPATVDYTQPLLPKADLLLHNKPPHSI